MVIVTTNSSIVILTYIYNLVKLLFCYKDRLGDGPYNKTAIYHFICSSKTLRVGAQRYRGISALNLTPLDTKTEKIDSFIRCFVICLYLHRVFHTVSICKIHCLRLSIIAWLNIHWTDEIYTSFTSHQIPVIEPLLKYSYWAINVDVFILFFNKDWYLNSSPVFRWSPGNNRSLNSFPNRASNPGHRHVESNEPTNYPQELCLLFRLTTLGCIYQCNCLPRQVAMTTTTWRQSCRSDYAHREHVIKQPINCVLRLAATKLHYHGTSY